MSPIKNPKASRTAAGGFTLSELMFAMSISAFVFAGVLSAWLFLGRNFTRLMSFQQQSEQGRDALYVFARDVHGAMQVATAGSSQLALTMPPQASPTTISYTYNATSGTLTRTDASGTTTTPLIGLTALNFSYFNTAGTATASSLSISQVELSYTSANGIAASGTQSSFPLVSSRVILRNKPFLQ